MPTQIIPFGSSSLIENIVYALPPRACFISSSLALEVSLNNSDWSSTLDFTVGSSTGSKFIRSTSGVASIITSNYIIPTEAEPVPPLDVTYDFPGTGTLPDPPWTNMSSFFLVTQGSGAMISSNFTTVAYWNQDVFNANQYSKGILKYSSFANEQTNYLSVRTSGNNDFAIQNGYVAGFFLNDISPADPMNVIIRKFVGGVATNFASVNIPVWADGDEIYVDVVGTTITVKHNGVTVNQATDSELTSGAPGAGGFRSGGAGILDNWQGGNVV